MWKKKDTQHRQTNQSKLKFYIVTRLQIVGISRLSRKSARKTRVVSSSSDSSEQESSESESSDSSVSDASSDSLSEDDDNPIVDTAFTEVISKKQRRYGKKTAGKVPKKSQ